MVSLLFAASSPSGPEDDEAVRRRRFEYEQGLDHAQGRTQPRIQGRQGVE
jgi:hypothetical protein